MKLPEKITYMVDSIEELIKYTIEPLEPTIRQQLEELLHNNPSEEALVKAVNESVDMQMLLVCYARLGWYVNENAQKREVKLP